LFVTSLLLKRLEINSVKYSRTTAIFLQCGLNHKLSAKSSCHSIKV